MNKITATTIMIRRSTLGLYLGVSRKDNPDAFGLPGGKVDPGETPEEAAIRELLEETGLTMTNPRLVFHGTSAGEKDFYVGTYVGDISGDLYTAESGRIQWVTAQQLIDGPFGAYNRALLESLGLWPEKSEVFVFQAPQVNMSDIVSCYHDPKPSPWFDATRKGFRPRARKRKS